jgi:queuosine precursor transporter
MYNELLFIAQVSTIGISLLIGLSLGQQALVALISMFAILANLFVIKQTTLFGLNATCSDAFTIGSVLGLNLLQEYWGKKSTQQAIWISFILLVVYTVLTQIHLGYLPSATDTMHQAYVSILRAMPRITIASLIVYLIVQYIDALLYGYLKSRLSTSHLILRNYTSLALSQLLDTVLFSFLGLYGLVDNLMQIICISYIIKLSAIALITPCIALSRLIVRKNSNGEL